MMIIFIYTNFVLLSSYALHIVLLLFCYLCCRDSEQGSLSCIPADLWGVAVGSRLTSDWLKFVLILCVCLHVYCVHLMSAVPMEVRRGH